MVAVGSNDRPDKPRGPATARPAHGSWIPRGGKRFCPKGGGAPQGAGAYRTLSDFGRGTERSGASALWVLETAQDQQAVAKNLQDEQHAEHKECFNK